MGLGNKFKTYLSPMDNDEVVEEGVVDGSCNEDGSVSADTKMTLFSPTTFDDGKDIAMELVQRKAAIVNLRYLKDVSAQRVIDFLNGVVFALNGKIQQIGADVFLCTPKNIPVEGQIEFGKKDNE